MEDTKVTEFKTGNIVKYSGQYNLVDGKGNFVREITCVKGKKFPPTTISNGKYVLADATNNNAGERKPE